ncbi:MAG: glutamine amidotransferase [Desulfitobacterium hafniense]|nr:glutamine amidotransferase [Desulfitobacterium hafniense]
MRLNICHLYPDLLDLYGDRGNIIALGARCKWRGIEPVIRKASLGEKLDFNEIDILFIGGGSDREQGLLFDDLMRHKEELSLAINNGLVVLAICGGYQLLGRYYQTASGEKIPGLGILDLWTEAGPTRLIGNIILRLNHNLEQLQSHQEINLNTIVGFENHSGKTFLGAGLIPLGSVVAGYGNNGVDEGEGVHYKNVIGTYLHGPLLPKNPHLADLLIQLALKRRGITSSLSKLDDGLEVLAHKYMVDRISATAR